MTTLHYSSIEQPANIKEVNFGGLFAIKTWMEQNVSAEDNIVFLANVQGEILISHDRYFIISFACRYIAMHTNAPTFIFEYPSFEEAYRCALDIKKDHRLCYSTGTKSSPYWNLL